ncbi:hypothetical protein [Stenotrophomonas sp. Iso1]|uniref:hypothetical protein n=1 Tax=Stenotrophomonas sp. Iso1 TaxID=2977283 RepID=UPI0022B77942|nr:hypothetical protein [Stenotrophomonas sp. Iso1]
MSVQQIELNPWHKRQAALIHHFTSMAYLKSILPRAEHLIAMADAMLEERSHLDAMGIAHANWNQTSTAIHFATHAYPALVEFRDGIVEDIALRAFERYGPAGENQCARMLSEYAPRLIWATDEQEVSFKAEAERAFRYAAGLSGYVTRPGMVHDLAFWLDWNAGHINRQRVPRFRVRTDLVGVSGKTPPRTGVYVPKDEPYGALQFAWTGGYGELDDVYDLNHFGMMVLQRVGRKGLWGDTDALYRMLDENRGMNRAGWEQITAADSKHSAPHIARMMFESHPCEWYFVEMIEGEYEDIDGTYAGTGGPSVQQTRVPARKPCPRAGWWYTPAQIGRRYFKQDDVFPVIANSDWGDTFWLWALDQSTPKLG